MQHFLPASHYRNICTHFLCNLGENKTLSVFSALDISVIYSILLLLLLNVFHKDIVYMNEFLNTVVVIKIVYRICVAINIYLNF